MSKRITNEEFYLAEMIQDYVDSERTKDKTVIHSLLTFRNDMICRRSNNQEYLCDIETPHGYCCDTCIQAELHDLWAQGIKTVGSCCGHGGKYPAYIQVLNQGAHPMRYIEQMLALGYEQIPPDKYGNGQACFVPKSKFIEFTGAKMDGERRDSEWR